MEILFEEGTYHFYPDFAFERTLCISNHDEDTIKRIAFDLTNCTHLTISGKNSDFIFHTELLAFYFEHGEDITLEGFSIDYERPAYSEGTIVSVNGPSMQLRIDKERFPYYVAHQRIFFTGENFCEEIPFWMEVDPEKGEPSEGPYETGFDIRPDSNYGIWKELEEGLVEVTLEGTGDLKSFEGYTPGHVIVLRHHPRSYPAAYVTASKDVTFRDVKIYHCAGMGVIAQFTENITLERVAITGKPGNGHWFSLAADATHFVYCRGLIHIKDCLFERQLDDAVNIHGIYTCLEWTEGRRARAQIGHHEQYGFMPYRPGDALRLDLEGLIAEKFQGLTPMVCANLPYNITTPVLTKLAGIPSLTALTVLIQKEAAQRFTAPQGSPEIGAFPLQLQYRMETELLFDVEPECFLPRPKVTSTVLRCVRRQQPAVAVRDEALFQKVLKGAFLLRRKTLSNSLASALPQFSKEEIQAAIAECGLPATVRGEALSLAEFAALTEALAKG